MAKPKGGEKKIPAKVIAERKRLQRALLDTYERLWRDRLPEEGNTQVATMTRANLSVQQWGNWKRGDDDMTLTSAVAVAFALDRRIDFALASLSDPSAMVPVLTNDEEGDNLSDDVLALAEEIDALPGEERNKAMAGIRGLLSGMRIASPPSPSNPAADHRGHGARRSK